LKKLLKWLWKHKFSIPASIILISCGLLLMLWAIFPNFSPEWTGIGVQINQNGEIEAAKKFWDWLNLLIVPVVIAIGIWWLNKKEKENELELTEKRAEYDRKLVEERTQELLLQSYLDHLSELLLANRLKESLKGSEIRSIARSRTLTTVRMLDPTRKGLLLQFLRESGLLEDDAIINLQWADFSNSNLSKANLRNATLSRINLNESEMDSAFLFQTNLSGALLQKVRMEKARIISANLESVKLDNSICIGTDFSGTNLSLAQLIKSDFTDACFNKSLLRSANLSGATFINVDFKEANLSMANLSNADFRGADFTNAILRGANLTNAKLRGAIIDNADFSFTNLSKTKLSTSSLSFAKSTELAIFSKNEDK